MYEAAALTKRQRIPIDQIGWHEARVVRISISARYDIQNLVPQDVLVSKVGSQRGKLVVAIRGGRTRVPVSPVLASRSWKAFQDLGTCVRLGSVSTVDAVHGESLRGVRVIEVLAVENIDSIVDISWNSFTVIL